VPRCIFFIYPDKKIKKKYFFFIFYYLSGIS